MRGRLDARRIKTLFAGIIVGLITGVIASIFRLIIAHTVEWVKDVYHFLHHDPKWIIAWVIFIAILGIIVGLLMKTSPQISGAGIPQVEGQLAGKYQEPWFPVLWKKFVCGIMGIGIGLMLGREGPSVQLGAVVGQGYAELTHRKGHEWRTLIASGSAAGLSAAFNAPIASTMFVIEEMYHNFSPVIWLTSFASAVCSNFVSLVVFGQVPILHIVYSKMLPLRYYWLLIGLGIVLGALGVLYQKVLLNLPKFYAKLKVPRYFDGLLIMLASILVGYFWTNAIGGSDDVIFSMAVFKSSVLVLVGLLIIRFVFSTLSYSSGLPGGIFLPILTLGSVIGCLYGQIMVNAGLMPETYVVNLVIFSMAGYFAAIGKAPFTAMLLIVEMVGSLKNLMPLALVSLTAYVTLDLMGGKPIYESLLQALIKPVEEEDYGYPDRIEVPVYDNSRLVGKRVCELKWPESSLLISIRHGEEEVIPHGDNVLEPGDTLVIETKHDNRAYVSEQIKNIKDREDG